MDSFTSLSPLVRSAYSARTTPDQNTSSSCNKTTNGEVKKWITQRLFSEQRSVEENVAKAFFCFKGFSDEPGIVLKGLRFLSLAIQSGNAVRLNVPPNVTLQGCFSDGPLSFSQGYVIATDPNTQIKALGDDALVVTYEQFEAANRDPEAAYKTAARQHGLALLEKAEKLNCHQTYQTALRFLEEASALSDNEVLGQLGTMELYGLGTGVAPSHVRAQRYLSQASLQGDEKAAKLNEQISNDQYIQTLKQTAHSKDFDQTFQANAFFELGTCQYAGLYDLPEQKSLAAVYFEQASERGSSAASETLSEMHYHGDGVEKNPERGLKFLIKAAEQGSAKANLKLGEKYLVGNQVKQDNKLAKAHLNYACENLEGTEKATATYLLGKAYLNTSLVDSVHLSADFKEGIRLLTEAFKGGNQEAGRLLAERLPQSLLTKLTSKAPSNQHIQ